MKSAARPLCLYHARVLPEWLDINDHMNVACYALVFDRASEVFMAHLGLDEAYIRERRASWAVLESHTTFERELRRDDPLRVCAQVLAADAKRIHLFQTLFRDGEELPAAGNELMILHLDLETRRAAPFPPALAERVGALARAHGELPSPPQRGRVIGLRRH
jgi:acyl-CoA thioester hydrolase